MTRLVLTAQGGYYVLTGIWPLVDTSAFESVTGPKTDDWLVHMVGALAVAIGLTLLAGVRAREIRRETAVLSAASALAFLAIDVVYVLNGTLGPIYLGDAVIEAGILIVLMVAGTVRRWRFA